MAPSPFFFFFGLLLAAARSPTPTLSLQLFDRVHHVDSMRAALPPLLSVPQLSTRSQFTRTFTVSLRLATAPSRPVRGRLAWVVSFPIGTLRRCCDDVRESRLVRSAGVNERVPSRVAAITRLRLDLQYERDHEKRQGGYQNYSIIVG